MPTAPRMNKPQGGYDFWADTLQPGLFGLYNRWTEQKPWPTPEQINAAVQNPGLLDREAMAGYAVDMAQPFAAKLGGLLGHMPIPEGGLFGITTWHGSPHKWTKPDISKVGTGEGAQAYGHGFYSAEALEVARQYQKNLSQRAAGAQHRGKLNGIEYPLLDDSSKKAMDILKLNDEDIDFAIKFAEENAPDAASILKSVKKGNAEVEFNQGNLYKLDIPDEDVAKYLDWDKPLSEQPEIVRRSIKSLPKETRTFFEKGTVPGYEPTMGEAYGSLSSYFDPQNYVAGQKIATEELMSLGIPGIRYLDGTSRSAGEGTYNYVTFDPSRIKVLERNGEDLQGLLGR